MYSLLLLLFAAFVTADINLDTPRGVPLSRKALYSGKDFSCLDGSNSIPFEWVNDDYCDCNDGSDEPGTAACPKGIFTCINLGHKPIDIPTSRVNDQICDCCDGSDEWAGHVKCPNICEEIGRKAREEEQKQAAIVREGYQKRLELAKEGKQAKDEKLKKIDEYKAQLAELEPKKTELDEKKKEIEKKETEAKDAHQTKWRAELEEKRKATDRFKAESAFEDLDVNKDKKIDIAELISHTELDKNLDGVLSHEEAKEYLDGAEHTDFETFVNDIWTKIAHLYKPPVPETTTEPPPSDTVVTPPPEKPKPEDSIPGEETEDEIKEDEVEDFDVDKFSKTDKGQPPSSEEEKMPDYDDSTKQLISESDEARRLFNEVDQKYRDVESELRKIEDYAKLDLGPNNEFAPFYQSCFEHTDRQYTYKLCLYDRTTQRNKDGGSETILGNYDSWAGPDGSKYSKQAYKHGTSCWNGPERSTDVRMICGTENKLISASEPARCEYLFEFSTPAVCEQAPSEHVEHEL